MATTVIHGVTIEKKDGPGVVFGGKTLSDGVDAGNEYIATEFGGMLKVDATALAVEKDPTPIEE